MVEGILTVKECVVNRAGRGGLARRREALNTPGPRRRRKYISHCGGGQSAPCCWLPCVGKDWCDQEGYGF